MFITFKQESESVQIFVKILKNAIVKRYNPIIFVETFNLDSVCVIGLKKQRFIKDFNLAKYTSFIYYNKDFVFNILESDDRINITPQATSVFPVSAIIRRYENFISSKYKFNRINSLTYELDIFSGPEPELIDMAQKVFSSEDQDTFVEENSIYSPKNRLMLEFSIKGSIGYYSIASYKIL